MIDAWSDLEAIRSILIAVFPVGNVPPEGMNKYMNVLKRNRRYDLSMLSLPAHNPFKNISRNADYILLNFSDNPQLYESPWDSIFLHRKVLAVVGLVHCPSNPDLDVVHDEFISALKQFPNALVKRCLAFEPLDSQQDLMERQNLVMVPNADTKHLQFYMSTLIMDVVERLICEMLEAARALSSSQELPYISSDKPVLHDPGKKKRLLPGRISKISADYSLLCGIVIDARELYLVSIDATKSSGDLVWRGAALEGLACCDPSASYDDRVALMEKAIRNYARRPDTEPLRVEAFMKLARFAASQNHTVESLNYLARAFELCVSVPIKDRISVAIESAVLSQLQGAKRKFGMFMREAALLHAQKERWHESLSLAMLCSQVYGLKEPTSQQPWESLQVVILTELVTWARAANRLRDACMYMTSLLTRVKSSVRQKAIVHDLCRMIPLVPKTQKIEMIGVPLVTNLELLPIENHLIPKAKNQQHSEFAYSAGNEDDVFLFRPSALSPERALSKAAAIFDLPIGQLLHLDITIRNPLLIELPISSISIDCLGTDYESFPLSPLLRSLEEKSIRIAVLPLSAGILKLNDVSIRVYGIDTYHQVDRLLNDPVSIRICSPMPLLKVETEDVYQGYFGQTLSIPVFLRNVGDVAANDIHLSLEGSDSIDSTMLEFKHDSELILKPGRSASVYVSIDCCQQKIGLSTIKVVYSAEKYSEMYRELVFKLPVTVESGLSIRSFEVYPFAQYHFSGKYSSGAKGSLEMTSFGPEDCMIVCEVVNSSEFRFSLSIPEQKKLKYEVEAHSTERVIFPFRRRSFGVESDICIVSLASNVDAMNDPTCTDEQFVSCRNQCINTLGFNWKKHSPPPLQGKITIPMSLITPSHIRYIVPDPFIFQFELNGSYDPHRQSASPTTIAISSPVSPCLHSPNSRFDSDYLITGGYHQLYPRGQFVNIKVVVSIRRATPMSMTISVRPSYQQSSGQFDYDLRHRLLWTGSWDHNLGIVEPDSSVYLNLNVCFIAIGRFMFELICRCEQDGSSPIVYSCSLPLLIETFDKNS